MNDGIQAGIKIHCETPTLKEYRTLCKLAGWHSLLQFEQLQRSLDSSIYAVTARNDEGRAVGMGRIVGDGVIYWYLQDITVAAEYRNRGIGTRILDELCRYVNERAEKRAFVALFATEEAQGLYESRGFGEHPEALRGMFTLSPVERG